MNPVRRLVGRLLRWLTERRARGRSLPGLAERLERSGRELEARLERASLDPAGREKIRHVVGIERWGQRRLRVLLGDPFDGGGHRPFRPDDADDAALRAAFADTRVATVALARDLAAAGVDPARSVPHDDLGELSARGWLVYLDGHAKIELARVRT